MKNKYIYIYIYIWANYIDITATSLEVWLIPGFQVSEKRHMPSCVWLNELSLLRTDPIISLYDIYVCITI